MPKHNAPTLIQPKLVRGMSYVIQLRDGRFILIDGGVYNAEDMKYLYELLAEKTPDNQKIVIAAWMFTHPHYDHIELASYFMQKYEADVDIRAFMYQFPDCEKMGALYAGEERVSEDVRILKESISSSYPDAAIYTIHTGEKYNFQGAEIEILFTAEDADTQKLKSYNGTSAAWRITFDNGTTFLVLGDCDHYACREIAARYGDYVKSDILQLAHHGLVGGDKELYQLIDPQICFWATPEERFLGNWPNEKYHYCLGEGPCDYNAWIRDTGIREREHYHHSVTTELIMDK